jgi:UDP-N-acetylglucosamine--N-acetylmuramyl-(pentapeptide) pyrophosphoryl-undecaprenol N-acetylglucosamine transferase
LLEADIELLYVGQSGSMEERIVQASGIPFTAIRAGKYRRSAKTSFVRGLLNISDTAKNSRDLIRLVTGVAQSISVLRKFKPDVVFIKGGFVSLPVGLAAGLLRIPYIIHESDLSPGISNKILAKRSKKIAVGFPARYYSQWPQSKLVYTGNPIRTEYLIKHRLEGVAYFHLDEKLPVVMVTGGSQGARAVNEVVVKALPELLKIAQVIHITGENEYDSVVKNMRKLNLSADLIKRYIVRAFLMHDMGLAYAASDVVISRAGANTIADLAALAKPAIIIPNYLMAGHQVDNAKALSRAGAAKVIQEQRLRPEILISQTKQILESNEEQSLLSQRIQTFGFKDAANRLAAVILVQGRHKRVEKEQPE